jgi:hypothetical protein
VKSKLFESTAASVIRQQPPKTPRAAPASNEIDDENDFKSPMPSAHQHFFAERESRLNDLQRRLDEVNHATSNGNNTTAIAATMSTRDSPGSMLIEPMASSGHTVKSPSNANQASKSVSRKGSLSSMKLEEEESKTAVQERLKQLQVDVSRRLKRNIAAVNAKTSIVQQYSSDALISPSAQAASETTPESISPPKLDHFHSAEDLQAAVGVYSDADSRLQELQDQVVNQIRIVDEFERSLLDLNSTEPTQSKESSARENDENDDNERSRRAGNDADDEYDEGDKDDGESSTDEERGRNSTAPPKGPPTKTSANDWWDGSEFDSEVVHSEAEIVGHQDVAEVTAATDQLHHGNHASTTEQESDECITDTQISEAVPVTIETDDHPRSAVASETDEHEKAPVLASNESVPAADVMAANDDDMANREVTETGDSQNLSSDKDSTIGEVLVNDNCNLRDQSIISYANAAENPSMIEADMKCDVAGSEVAVPCTAEEDTAIMYENGNVTNGASLVQTAEAAGIKINSESSIEDSSCLDSTVDFSREILAVVDESISSPSDGAVEPLTVTSGDSLVFSPVTGGEKEESPPRTDESSSVHSDLPTHEPTPRPDSVDPGTMITDETTEEPPIDSKRQGEYNTATTDFEDQSIEEVEDRDNKTKVSVTQENEHRPPVQERTSRHEGPHRIADASEIREQVAAVEESISRDIEGTVENPVSVSAAGADTMPSKNSETITKPAANDNDNSAFIIDIGSASAGSEPEQQKLRLQVNAIANLYQQAIQRVENNAVKAKEYAQQRDLMAAQVKAAVAATSPAGLSKTFTFSGSPQARSPSSSVSTLAHTLSRTWSSHASSVSNIQTSPKSTPIGSDQEDESLRATLNTVDALIERLSPGKARELRESRAKEIEEQKQQAQLSEMEVVETVEHFTKQFLFPITPARALRSANAGMTPSSANSKSQSVFTFEFVDARSKPDDDVGADIDDEITLQDTSMVDSKESRNVDSMRNSSDSHTALEKGPVTNDGGSEQFDRSVKSPEVPLITSPAAKSVSFAPAPVDKSTAEVESKTMSVLAGANSTSPQQRSSAAPELTKKMEEIYKKIFQTTIQSSKATSATLSALSAAKGAFSDAPHHGVAVTKSTTTDATNKADEASAVKSNVDSKAEVIIQTDAMGKKISSRRTSAIQVSNVDAQCFSGQSVPMPVQTDLVSNVSTEQTVVLDSVSVEAVAVASDCTDVTCETVQASSEDSKSGVSDAGAHASSPASITVEEKPVKSRRMSSIVVSTSGLQGFTGQKAPVSVQTEQMSVPTATTHAFVVETVVTEPVMLLPEVSTLANEDRHGDSQIDATVVIDKKTKPRRMSTLVAPTVGLQAFSGHVAPTAVQADNCPSPVATTHTASAGPILVEPVTGSQCSGSSMERVVAEKEQHGPEAEEQREAERPEPQGVTDTERQLLESEKHEAEHVAVDKEIERAAAEQERQRLETETREAERAAVEQERKRTEAENREAERARTDQERKHIEAEEREAELAAAEEDRKRTEAEKGEAERVAADQERQRIEAEKREAERVAADQEKRRIKVEKREAERVAAEQEKHCIEAEKREAERVAVEKERQRIEAEKREAERVAADQEKRRIEVEKRERVAAEQDRQRIEAKKREAERVTAEQERQRIETERREAERVAAEHERQRMEAEKHEIDRRDRERLAVEAKQGAVVAPPALIDAASKEPAVAVNPQLLEQATDLSCAGDISVSATDSSVTAGIPGPSLSVETRPEWGKTRPPLPMSPAIGAHSSAQSGHFEKSASSAASSHLNNTAVAGNQSNSSGDQGNVSSDAGSTVEEEPGCFCFAFAGNHADSAGKPAGSNVGSGGIRNNITLANTNAAGAKSFRPKLI